MPRMPSIDTLNAKWSSNSSDADGDVVKVFMFESAFIVFNEKKFGWFLSFAP